MTAHELARRLLAGPDLPVHQAYPYGDYWRTTVAPEVTDVAPGVVTHSSYHDMDKLVEDEDAEDRDGARRAIILS